MAIRNIKSETCIGCGLCVKCCPVDVLRIDPETGKAFPKYPKDCVICCICIAQCPTESIEMTLEQAVTFPASW